MMKKTWNHRLEEITPIASPDFEDDKNEIGSEEPSIKLERKNDLARILAGRSTSQAFKQPAPLPHQFSRKHKLSENKSVEENEED